VRFIFQAVADLGWSLRRVCRELEARGVRPPAGNGHGSNKAEGRWNATAIRTILHNRKYTGDLTFNVKRMGKYSHWRGGEVEGYDAVNRKSRPSAAEDVVVVPDVIPAIIDRETFARAGAALVGGKWRTAPGHKAGQKDVPCASYLFTHLLVCGDCGSWMRGWPGHGEKSYHCSLYKEYGPKACHKNAVKEAQVRDAIMRALVDDILSPARLDAVEAEVERRLKAEARAGEADRLRSRVRQLEKDIDKGNALLVRLPEDRIPAWSGCRRAGPRRRRCWRRPASNCGGSGNHCWATTRRPSPPWCGRWSASVKSASDMRGRARAARATRR
jgi:hypothetical protein